VILGTRKKPVKYKTTGESTSNFTFWSSRNLKIFKMPTKEQIAESLKTFEALLGLAVTSDASNEKASRLAECVYKQHHTMFWSRINFSASKFVFNDEDENAVVETNTVQVTGPSRAQVCKAFYNGRVCPDQEGCLSKHPEVCERPECKTRRSEDCTAWHPPLCKSFKRLTHCMNGDTCTARHPATCTTKDCSYQSGCALWHTKTPRTVVLHSQVPMVNANSGNSSGRTQARRSDSSGAKSGVKGKGTYVTRQLAENVKMREKIAVLEQKRVQFHPQPGDFPPLHAAHRTPSYQPQQVHNSLLAPPHSFPWCPPVPLKGLVPPGPPPDISALIAALLPLQAVLQAFLPR
jgi:hypothetical protein